MRLMVNREHHSHMVGSNRCYWWTDRLWAESVGLPTEIVSLDSIPEFDMDCWFDGRAPTCRQVAEHARRINDSDLNQPIILSSNGQLMDGGHRIAKAYLLGQETIRARRFSTDPAPDWIEPKSN